MKTDAQRARARVSLWLVPVVAAFVVADLAMLAVALNGDWAFDFACCYQQAGQRLLDGRDLYDWSATYTFRYSPWAAVLFAPLTLFTAEAAAIAWFVVKAAILAGAAWWYSEPWSGRARVAVVASVLFFPPLVHDLVIGNVSVLTFAVLLALSRESRAAPPLLGVLMLLAPKPHLLPVAAWLLVRRPRDAGLAMATGAIGLVAGVVLFGTDPWLGWLDTFREPLGREFTANIGLSGLFGPIGVIAGALGALAIFALALRAPRRDGLSLAILSGVVLGPYVFIHYLSGVLVAAEPMLRRAPRQLVAFPALVVAGFPFTSAWLVLLAAVQYRSARAATVTAGGEGPTGGTLG